MCSQFQRSLSFKNVMKLEVLENLRPQISFRFVKGLPNLMQRNSHVECARIYNTFSYMRPFIQIRIFVFVVYYLLQNIHCPTSTSSTENVCDISEERKWRI
jgi:hypothetical protein